MSDPRYFDTDGERVEFLRGLTEEQVTPWEWNFARSVIAAQTGANLLTEKQRGIVDELFMEYGGQP